MIIAKLNVTKIDKTKLFKGLKGTYLDICIIETPNSEYGDYMVVQDMGKAAREAGQKGPILGNGKTIGRGPQSAPEAKPSLPLPLPLPGENDDVPF